jgi:hypothetical protein
VSGDAYIPTENTAQSTPMMSSCRCLSWTTSRTMTTTNMKKTITAPRSLKSFVCNDGHEDCIRSKQLVMSVISMTIRCESPVAWLYFDELRRQKEDWREVWTGSLVCLSEVPEFSWLHTPSIYLYRWALSSIRRGWSWQRGFAVRLLVVSIPPIAYSSVAGYTRCMEWLSIFGHLSSVWRPKT